MGEETKVKTLTDTQTEVNQLASSVIGKINSLDSKNDRASVVQELINTLIAGVELSRIEKIGILYRLCYCVTCCLSTSARRTL